MERAAIESNSYAGPNLQVSTESFINMGPIPQEFTCDGNNLMPVIHVSNIPGTTVSLAMIVEDPDAPRGTFTHFIAWNLPFEGENATISLDKISNESIGTNDFGDIGWGGPCPPKGSSPHKYLFKVYALDKTIDLPRGTDRGDILIAMHGNIIATGELIGEYAR